MASKDREWFFPVDLFGLNQKVMSGEDVMRSNLMEYQYLLNDNLTREDYGQYLDLLSAKSSKLLHRICSSSGGFIETKVLLYCAGMGAANNLDETDGLPRLPILHFLALFPDIPASALRLFLGLAVDSVGASYANAQVSVDGRSDEVFNGGTALHAAVQSLDLSPMYSSDEYIVDNAVDKIRILLQHGAKVDTPNKYGMTPYDLVQMLEGQWDTDRGGESSRWPEVHREEADYLGLTQSFGLLAKPKHVTTPLAAKKAFELMRDVLDGKQRVLFKEIPMSSMVLIVDNFNWEAFRKRLTEEKRKRVPDSSWLVETNNPLGIPFVWFFLARVYKDCVQNKFTKGYIPIKEFEELLDIYYKHPPNSDTRNEELEQIYWYCVGASNYLGNPTDFDPQSKYYGLPQPIFERSNPTELSVGVRIGMKPENPTSTQSSQGFAVDKSIKAENVKLEGYVFPEAIQKELEKLKLVYPDLSPKNFYTSTNATHFIQKLIALLTFEELFQGKKISDEKVEQERIQMADELMAKLPLKNREELWKTLKGVSPKEVSGLLNRGIENYLRLSPKQEPTFRTGVLKRGETVFQNIKTTFKEVNENLDFFKTPTPKPKPEQKPDPSSAAASSSSSSSLSSDEPSTSGSESFVSLLEESFRDPNDDSLSMPDDFAGSASQQSTQEIPGVEEEEGGFTDALPDASREVYLDVENDFMRKFFRAIIDHDIFVKESNFNKLGVLRRNLSPLDTNPTNIASSIHQAMRVGDLYSLRAIAQSRAGKSLGNLDLPHPTNKRSPIQTAIHAGHSKDTVTRLYDSLFQSKK